MFFLGGGSSKIMGNGDISLETKNNQETDFHVEDFIDHDQQFD